MRAIPDHRDERQPSGEGHEHVERPVLGAIDPRRPDDGVLDPRCPDGLLAGPLRPEPHMRCVGRRARSRAVDEPPDAGPHRGPDQSGGATMVELLEGESLRRLLDGERGEGQGLDDRLRARHGLRQRGFVHHVTDHDQGAERGDPPGRPPRVRGHHRDLPALTHQPADHRRSHEPASSRHQDHVRSLSPEAIT